LATTDDARVHCAVLKIRAVPAPRRTWRRRHRSWPKVWPSSVRDTKRPFPQDPTACSARPSPRPTFRAAIGGRTSRPGSDARTE